VVAQVIEKYDCGLPLTAVHTNQKAKSDNSEKERILS
jgi:hypothetical protein